MYILLRSTYLPSVFGLVPAQGVPDECSLCGPVERGFVYVPAPGARAARRERRMLTPNVD